MAGILDAKTRIIDFIITNEGKSNLAADGGLNVSYISFSDNSTFYKQLYTTGSMRNYAADASGRLMIEANSTKADDIFIHSSSNVSANLLNSFEKFSNLRLISTIPKSRSLESFKLSETKIEFDLNMKDLKFKEGITEYLDFIFENRKFQHILNYKYLPPINSLTKSPMADYQQFCEGEFAIDEIFNQLKKKKKRDIRISSMPTDSFICQVFEEDSLGKGDNLKIIDYGIFPNDIKDSAGYRVFFIGKMVETLDENMVFANIFTLVFE